MPMIPTTGNVEVVEVEVLIVETRMEGAVEGNRGKEGRRETFGRAGVERAKERAVEKTRLAICLVRRLSTLFVSRSGRNRSPES